MTKVTLRLTKSTKGTHVYSEPDTTEVKTFPTIYIQKSAFPSGKVPQTVTVTIEFNE